VFCFATVSAVSALAGDALPFLPCPASRVILHCQLQTLVWTWAEGLSSLEEISEQAQPDRGSQPLLLLFRWMHSTHAATCAKPNQAQIWLAAQMAPCRGIQVSTNNPVTPETWCPSGNALPLSRSTLT